MTLKEFLSAITILRYITVPKTITNCFTLIFVYKACTSYFHFQKIFQLSSISLFQVYMFLTFICVRVFNVSEITSYQIEKERISFPFTIIISVSLIHPKLSSMLATLFEFIFQRWFLIELKNQTPLISREITDIDTTEGGAQRTN